MRQSVLVKEVEKTWLSIEEASKYLSIGKRKVLEMVHSKEIRGSRCGNKILIDLRSIDQYLRRNEI